MKKFKKTLLLIMTIVFGFTVVGCKKNENKIVIAEVAHSVFYAPMYAAIELGYFSDYGIDVELVNANGADKVMASLLSGDAQVGLMGPEASIYVYLGEQDNYAINFAQLTRTDGSFIVGREKIDNFNLQMLAGKSILGGRKGGVPEMTLEYVLKENGLIVGQDDESVLEKGGVLVRTDIAFAAMAGSFISGEGDFTTLFEPTATTIAKENDAYVLAAVGQYAGEVPYTAFSALKEYIEDNEDKIQDFTNAIYKGQLWVLSHTAEEVAKVVQPHFSSNSVEDLTTVMQRYKDINAWCISPFFNEAGLERLMTIMMAANELETTVPYNKIVTTKYALIAME